MSAPQPDNSESAPALIGSGRLVLVVGPSGAGKDTLIDGAKKALAQNSAVVFPRRVVTRPTTSAEDHDSLSEVDFDRAVESGMFAFWWPAHGLKYGIPGTVDGDIRAGRTVVCNVSRSVVATLRARYARIQAVLITAPADILSARLAGRSRDSDGSLAERIGRNDAFARFEADRTIDNVGAPEAGIQRLVEAIDGKAGAG
jgi:ribose 1,5-bisphosphokinase